MYSLKSNTYFWGTVMFVQVGFLYLIVTKHKLTVWGPTGRRLTSTTSPATLRRSLPWSTSIFMKKEHYEEFNIKRKHYWSALRPQQCPHNVTFEEYSGANQWRHGAAHETVVLKRSGLLVHLIVFERTIFCVAFLREMLTGPPTTRCTSWSPPSRKCWSASPGRTSRGPTAG